MSLFLSFVDNRMSTMSRVSNASRSAMLKAQTVSRGSRATTLRSLATASGDDAKKPTALAKLHLEDGTTLVGYSFGSHQAVEGEVSDTYNFYSRLCIRVETFSVAHPFRRRTYCIYLCFGMMTTILFRITCCRTRLLGRFRHGYGWISRKFDRP